MTRSHAEMAAFRAAPSHWRTQPAESAEVAMVRTRRTLRAFVFPFWEHWVVHVPAAEDVHALVLDVADAPDAARAAAATVLGVDPASISVRLSDGRSARLRVSSRSPRR